MKTLSYVMLGLLLSVGASEVLGRGLGGGFAGGGFHGGGFAGGGHQGGFAGGMPAGGGSFNRTPSFGGMSGFSRPAPSRPSPSGLRPPEGFGGRPEGFGGRPDVPRPSFGPRPGERPSAGDLSHFLHLPPETRPAGKVPEQFRPGGEGKVADRIRQDAGRRPENHELISRGVDREAAGKLRDQWNRLSPERRQEIQHRHDWAQDLRQHIHQYGYGPDWQHRHPDWRHPNWPHPYWHWWGRHPWHYWWTYPTWINVTGWIIGPWGPPVYYDYGGNVTVNNNTVYVNGNAAGTTAEYAQQAIDLAGTGGQALAAEAQDAPQEPPDGAKETDPAADPWMPLGVFAVVHQEQDTPTMFLQLAVRKDGMIAGTYHNTASDTFLPVQGAVDRQTQRAAWSFGENKQTVMEAGIYNLTREVTQCLVHFGKDKTQTWLLVRLEKPADEAAAPSPTANPG